MDTEKKNVKYIGAFMAFLLSVSVCLCFISPVKTYASNNETDVNVTNLWQPNIDKINNNLNSVLETYSKFITNTQKYSLQNAADAMRNAISENAYNEAKKAFNEIKSVVKYKSNKYAAYDKKLTNNKEIMNSSQKKEYKNRLSELLDSEGVKEVNGLCNKMDKIIKKAKDGQWLGYVQVSCYGPYEGETITATGRTITNGTYYIAVPSQRIVSKSSWEKMSSSKKQKYFYYHETIYLKKGSTVVKASVEDCGGFGGYGITYNGKWCERLFDLTPAVFNSLGVKSTGLVKWHY